MTFMKEPDQFSNELVWFFDGLSSKSLQIHTNTEFN